MSESRQNLNKLCNDHNVSFCDVSKNDRRIVLVFRKQVDDDSLARLFIGDFSHSSVALDCKGAPCIRVHDTPVLDENNATLTCAGGVATEEA